MHDAAPVTIACPGCQQRLSVPANRGPLRVRCARCAGEFDWSPPLVAPARHAPSGRPVLLALLVALPLAALAALGVGLWLYQQQAAHGPSHFESIDPETSTSADMDRAMEEW